MSQATSANKHVCRGQVGNPIVNALQSRGENSASKLNCIVRKNPEPRPTKNLAMVNVTQFLEIKPASVDTRIITIDE